MLLPWLALAALPAAAQTLPARFTVAGVAQGDVLNVRERPSASARILGSFQPGATGIEVIERSPDGRWGLVPLREGAGWVSMRYLRAEAPSATPLPRPLYCLGTEPFWSLAVTPQGAQFERMGQPAIRLRQHGEVAGFTGGVMAFDAGGETLDLTVIRARCSDGMSDRPYGFRAMVWNRGGTFLEGCCKLSNR